LAEYTTPATVEVDEGTYEVSASYEEFSESKTVRVGAGETVTVEFRWYRPKGTLIIKAYVDDVEVPAAVEVRRVG